MEENVLAPVAHRQYVFTVPRLLRPMFARRRAWIGELCPIAARLLEKACRAAVRLRIEPEGVDKGSHRIEFHIVASDDAGNPKSDIFSLHEKSIFFKP